MEYVPLGRSGLRVSRAGLGAMTFGNLWGIGVDEAEAARIVAAFCDTGHNFIDTANNYNEGQSEEMLGRALKGRRDSVVLATKGAMPGGSGPNDQGLSRVHLTRALEASLRRLDTDYIDLYQCHIPDPQTPIEETMATLDDFVRSGKVRYVGCSNFTAAQIVAAQWAAADRAGTPFVSLQSQYSLLVRDIESEILPTCQRYGLGTLVWSPLANGILAGRYTRGVAPATDTRIGRMLQQPDGQGCEWARRQLTERDFRIAEAVAAIAADLDRTPAEVALAWVASRPHITSVIVGVRTTEQLEQNLAALSLDLPDDVIVQLDDASGPPPGPIDGRDTLAA